MQSDFSHVVKARCGMPFITTLSVNDHFIKQDGGAFLQEKNTTNMPSIKNPYVKKSSRKPLYPFTRLAYFLLFLLIAVIYFVIQKSPSEQTTWNAFKHKMLLTHDVEKITVVNKEIAEIYLKKESLRKNDYRSVSKNFFGTTNPGPHYYLPIGSVDVFEQDVKEAQQQFPDQEKVEIDYVHAENNGFSSLLKWILSFVIIALVWFFILRTASTRDVTYVKNAARLHQAYKRLVKTIKPYWIVYKGNNSSKVVDFKYFFSQRA